MNNQPIGIFDSGVGGLTVWKELSSYLPHETTWYIADSLHAPYGNKTYREIYAYAKAIVNFFVKKKVKLIVVACNTVTVSCLDQLRKEFVEIPIIGTVPVIKTASTYTKNGRIGVLSTKVTAHSRYQRALIAKFCANNTVISVGTDRLVPFVEMGIYEGTELETVLKEELNVFKKHDIDILALGCTHFPYLKQSIQSILGSNVMLLDSGLAIARQVQKVLSANYSLSSCKSQDRYFTTGNPVQFQYVVETLLKESFPKVEKIVL